MCAIEKRSKERKTGGVLITFALLWWMLILSSKGMSIKNSIDSFTAKY